MFSGTSSFSGRERNPSWALYGSRSRTVDTTVKHKKKWHLTKGAHVPAILVLGFVERLSVAQGNGVPYGLFKLARSVAFLYWFTLLIPHPVDGSVQFRGQDATRLLTLKFVMEVAGYFDGSGYEFIF